MKIKLIILLLTFVCAKSQVKPVTDKANIDLFIKNYFIAENQIDLGNVPVYLNINTEQYNKLDPDKKKIFLDYLQMLVKLERDEMQKCLNDYQVVLHSKTGRKLLEDYRLQYPDLSKVYYVVCGGKIFTHFILDDKHRIISFTPNVFTTHGGRVEPFMLNEIK